MEASLAANRELDGIHYSDLFEQYLPLHVDEDLSVPEGKGVEVQIKVIPSTRMWGEGILRTTGAWRTIPNGMRSWSGSTRNAEEGSNDQGIARNRSREDHRSGRGSWHVGWTSR